MNYVISGYYGFSNSGDEALLSAMLNNLRKYDDRASITVLSGNPEHTRRTHGVKAVSRVNPFALITTIAGADLFISGGGSLLQDVTGPFTLPYYLLVIMLALLLGRPVMFYAQGIGPITRGYGKWLMKLVANRVQLITVRDSESPAVLAELGVQKPPVLVTADPVFTLCSSSQEIEHMKSRLMDWGAVPGRTVCIAMRRWPEMESHFGSLAAALDTLSNDGYSVLLFPMEHPADVNVSLQVAEKMHCKAIVVNEHLSVESILAIINQCEMVVAMRLHALIFAAVEGTPFAGISYDPKIDAFLASFGSSALPNDQQVMESVIRHILSDAEARERIRRLTVTVRDKADLNARLAVKLAASKRLAPGELEDLCR